MKYRDYKQFTEGSYYHIYNRGNNKQDIFKDEADYALFSSRLKENLFPPAKMPFAGAGLQAPRRKVLPAGAFELICYCLMPNHFHLLIKQCTELPLSKLLSKVCASYSKCFNLKYERVGQVFQDQFKAIEVENNDYLVWLSAYVHSNPTVAGLTQRPEDWQWSSYREYFKKEGASMCNIDIVRQQFESFGDYEKFVFESQKMIREKKKAEHLLFD